ncbi:hypothetical protein [Halobacteriovorax sp. ZH2_bin.1]|uniref:hypothetical protein n=1 Tax=Halobacteriovorax sp. ZH2_bin.1 TaxID=3157724 RepID=UPI0037145E95
MIVASLDDNEVENVMTKLILIEIMAEISSAQEATGLKRLALVNEAWERGEVVSILGLDTNALRGKLVEAFDQVDERMKVVRGKARMLTPAKRMYLTNTKSRKEIF